MTRLKVFFSFALLCIIAQGAWAWTGSGSEADPYQISTVEDWNTLCTNVNNGSNTYSGKFFKLMAEITVEETFDGVPTKMVGKGENVNFRGTFDGGGHTLTVNYVDNHDESASAPFRFIRNATIKNLHVAGSITKNYNKFAGGLVGVAYGTCHISNCHSSVEIHGHTMATAPAAALSANSAPAATLTTPTSTTAFSMAGLRAHIPIAGAVSSVGLKTSPMPISPTACSVRHMSTSTAKATRPSPAATTFISPTATTSTR